MGAGSKPFSGHGIGATSEVWSRWNGPIGIVLALGGLAAVRAAPVCAQAVQALASPPAPAVKRVEASPVEARAPRIDGRLEEGLWATAEVATDFVQMRPEPGSPASRRTEARVLFDADAIYVGMRLYDEPDSVVAQLARRDASGIYSDWAHVLIDSYHDHRTAFRFSVTPGGTKKDVLHYEDVREDVNWDAVWEVATEVDSLGWTAEFRIPLSQLRFSTDEVGADDAVWGVNFGREIARYGEWSWWSPVLPNSGGMVSESGELGGLTDLESPRRLEVLPYSVGSMTRAPLEPGNPFYRSTDPFAAMGLDIRYGLTSNLTLSATLNPDFGQVEADPSVVNLSAFETFFPEKRPFFIEGANIFEFGIGTSDGSGESLFYSRRIGRAPQRAVGNDGEFVQRPDATTILGAAKLSGKTASGWTFGFLDAVTAEESARIAGPDGGMIVEQVEPMANYAVASVARDFRRGRSSVGALFTAANRRLSEGDFGFLRSAAYAVGLRGEHRFAAGAWEASAFIGGSHIRGSAEAIAEVQEGAGHYYQRPDADHIEFDPTRTSLSGLIANFGVWKIGGGSLRGGVGGHLRTPGFEVNDLGFQMEADQAQLFANLRYHQFEPRGPFRSFMIGLNPYSAWTTGGERIWTQIGTFGNVQLNNFWNGGWWGARRFASLGNGTLRGGPAIRRPGGYRYSFWLNSDGREPVIGHVSLWGGVEDQTGSHDFGISPGLTVRPSGRLNLSLFPSVTWNRPEWQYVGQPEDDAGETHYVFGALDQTTFSLTTRLNLTLTPTLSFELYAQPFVSGGDYSDFMEVSDPRASSFDERFAEYAGTRLRYDETAEVYRADPDGDGVYGLEFDDPDFNFRQMRGNAVLRWEYLPGSTLFLVWSQSRTASGTDGLAGDPFDIGRDMRRLFNADPGFPTPQTNVFMVKVDYWISF